MIFFLIHVLVMNTIEAIAGFGSISIGVPILSLFWGTEVSVAIFTLISLFLLATMLVSQHKKINVREFLLITACILPIMPIGYMLYAKLRYIEWALRLILGTMVALFSGREILQMLRKRPQTEMPKLALYLSLGIGSVIQGMFSMGAPLINIYALSRIKDKSEFRATMVSVWLCTNSITTLYRAFVLQVYTTPILMKIAYALPLVFLAFFIGNRLHYKISNEKFASFVYIIQFLSGLISIAGGISQLV